MKKKSKRTAPNKKWTELTLRKLALRYKTRKEFKASHSGAVSAARKLGLMDEICEHMSRLGSRYYRYVYEVFDFPEVYIGLSADPQTRFKDHIRNSPKAIRELFKREDKTIIISKLLTHDEAARRERELIKRYRNLGDWDVLNSHSGGGLGSLYRVWNTRSAARVLRGKTLKEITTHHYGAYQYAKNSPDRHKLFSLIKWERKRNIAGEKGLSFDELCKAAKGITQAELKRKDPSAYWALQRNPRRNEIKKLMKLSRAGRLIWTDDAIVKAVANKLPSQIPKGALRRIQDHPRRDYFRSLMKRTKEKWTFERICEVAKGLSPSEFERRWPGGYHAACYHPRKKFLFGLMDIKHPSKVTPHLPKRVRRSR